MEETVPVKKTTLLIIVSVVVAIAAFAVGYLVGQGSTGAAIANTDNGNSDIIKISDPFGDDAVLGNKNAPIIVIEFSDYQCPYCSAAAGYNQDLIDKFKAQDPTWIASEPKLMEAAKSGKIGFVFKDFPLSNLHQFANKAAEAAECAGEQGKYYEYHDKLFENQNTWSTGDAITEFKKYASDLGLDTSKFNQCLDSDKYANEVQKDFQDGVSYKVEGTPTFFIGNVKDGFEIVVGAQSYSVFEQAINQ